MESSTICERCRNNIFTKSLSYLFSCKHSLCSQCIARIIAFNHIQTIFTQDQIQIHCPCQQGTKLITVTDIPQILVNVKIPTTCSSDVSAQVNQIDVSLEYFRTHVDCVLNKTIQKMDELIQLIQDYKLSYNKKMKQILQRGELFLHLLKFCYLDFNKSHVSFDSHLLKDLTTWNMELTTETEQKVKMVQEDLREYFKIQPVENIHIHFAYQYLNTQDDDYLILRDWMKNPLTLTGHSDYVHSLIQLKDGRIASGSEDSTMKIWEVKEKEFENTLTLRGHNGYVHSLIQLKDGRIASGSEDTTIKIWEVKEKEFMNTLTLTGHDDPVRSLIQMDDGRIASGSEDSTMKIWEVKEKEFENTLTLRGHNGDVNSIIQLKDGRIVSGSYRIIHVWEVKEKEIKNTLTLFGHNSSVCSLIQLKDGRIVSGSEDSTIKIWVERENVFKNTLILKGHNGRICSLIQLKDGRIASCSSDKTIKIWEVAEKEFTSTVNLTGHNDWICSLIQLKDGRIASGSDDYTIKVWG